MIFRILGKIAPVAVVAAVLAFGQPVPAGASLIGDMVTVTTEFGFPVTNTSDTVLVGNNVEFTSGDGTDLGTNFLFPGDSVDILSDSVEITFAAFPGIFPFIMTFSDLDWVGNPLAAGLIGVTLADPGNVVAAGYQANVLSPGSFQFQGSVDTSNGAAFTLNLVVDHNTPVPEPGTAWMVLLAVGALGAAGAHQRRRNRRETAA